MKDVNAPVFFLVAGEPSGDRLGAALMKGLRELVPDVVFHGVGGVEMQAAGLNSIFPMDELSVMGLAEILPKYFALKRRIKQTAEAVIELSPDALITIDSPDFSFRVAKQVKAASDIRTVHYVAPTVWAWRPGRVAKLQGVIDQMLALFPFEPKYWADSSIQCDFVGHPIVAEVAANPADLPAVIDEKRKTLVVLPGSRKSEIKRLAPIFGAAIHKIKAVHPDLQITVAAARSVANELTQQMESWPAGCLLFDPSGMSVETAEAQKRAIYAQADFALAASGTVSLELAAANTPMVVAYDLAPLSRIIMRRLYRQDTVTLVNLISDTRHVPEFLLENCTPDKITKGVTSLMNSDQVQMRQRDAMSDTMAALGQGGEAPGLRAAKAILRDLSDRPAE
ncbi:lipid-A-disaccharide synthase [Rhodobacterales bacterium HTCC2150]|nr:lipid-A-disaccharide synthase [Rhodobacterales bacterium HTCC2150] [Rhodobacteraceae bacterium HTCC2150]